jgi:nucleotide-binding universal stress UspA family protein
MKILIAVEDETYGMAAIDFVHRCGWTKNVNFKLFHAIEPLLVDNYMSFIPSPVLGDIIEERTKSAKLLLDQLESKLKSVLNDCTVEKLVLEDFSKSAILEESKRWNADLIILGSHGRRGMNKFLLGSVSQTVAEHADVPVLIVRIPQKQ